MPLCNSKLWRKNPTIEDALRIASRFEAYESVLHPKGPPQGPEGGKGPRRHRDVYVVDTKEVTKNDKYAQLQKQTAELKEEVARLKSQKDKGPCQKGPQAP